ncbi:uncharacterized protein LOC142924749 [Petromyzon marinus]|uniref:uncharacterized protein LOC142924749 n=1 Tax=Petromyzon marinus TaxID=7757 RepID=UPI003F6F8BD4
MMRSRLPSQHQPGASARGVPPPAPWRQWQRHRRGRPPPPPAPPAPWTRRTTASWSSPVEPARRRRWWLINAPLVSYTPSHTPTGSRYRHQRCLFRLPSTPSMGSSRAAWAAGVTSDFRVVTFTEQQQQEAVAVWCKRAERTPGGMPGRSKRHRGDGGGNGGGDGEESERGGSASSVCRKSMSACDDITLLLEVSPDRSLIGDFTRPHVLPLVSGKDESLKYVSADTLSLLLAGEFRDAVGRFLVIDCRYPYEFLGGHIKGAVNVVTEGNALSQLLVSPLHLSEPRKRVVLVFHCEFSSERGPRMCRFVRASNRNSNPYPRLHYPELYVLHGGYRAFYPAHTFAPHNPTSSPQHHRRRPQHRHRRHRHHHRSGVRMIQAGSCTGDTKVAG